MSLQILDTQNSLSISDSEDSDEDITKSMDRLAISFNTPQQSKKTPPPPAQVGKKTTTRPVTSLAAQPSPPTTSPPSNLTDTHPSTPSIISNLLETLVDQVVTSFTPRRYLPPPAPIAPTSISYFTKGLQTSFSVPRLAEMTARFQRLRDLPLPEQRTEAWYQFRNDRLTASDLGMLFGSPSEYQTCLLRKCRTLTEVKSAKSGGGAACRHGIKYEDVAIQIYEYRNSVRVHDFGCIPHSTLECFAASPDGICDTSNPVYAGRMVEIKCPYSRQLGPTVNPHPIKDIYWAQMQGQLEVCDLPYCDFLEVIIKEYDGPDSFWNDSDGSGRCQANGLEKGVVATQYPNTPRQKFFYSPIGLEPSRLREWCRDVESKGMVVTFWRLEQYVCRLVARNPDWWLQVEPHIRYFWNQVIYYRTNSKYYLYPQKVQRSIKQLFQNAVTPLCAICQQPLLPDQNIVPHPNRNNCPDFFHQDCLEQFWNSPSINGDSQRYPNDPQSLLKNTCLLDSDSD